MILHCMNREVCRHMTRVIRRVRNGTLPKAGQDALISTFRQCWKMYRRSMMVFTITRKPQESEPRYTLVTEPPFKFKPPEGSLYIQVAGRFERPRSGD